MPLFQPLVSAFALASARAGLRAPASLWVPLTRIPAWIATLALVLVLAPWPVARAQAATGGVVVDLVDDTGRPVRLAQPPRRVVSLLPSLTETVCALGACERLVGVDDFSNWPASVSRLPRLGGLDDTRIEQILALRPDLVLVSTSSRAASRLSELGLSVAAFEPRSLADVRRVLAQVGSALGLEPGRAGQLWRHLDGQVEQAARRIGPSDRGQRVYFEIGSGPYAAGPASFIGGLLERLGAVNVVPPELGAYPLLSPEFVLRARAQRVMLGARGLAEAGGRAGWRTLPAWRDGHICAFDDAQMDTLVRPGPRLGEAAALLASCLEGAMDKTAPEPARRKGS